MGIQQINRFAKDFVKKNPIFSYKTVRKKIVGGRHSWLNGTTIPRRIGKSRLGLRKREEMAEKMMAENNGLLVSKGQGE